MALKLVVMIAFNKVDNFISVLKSSPIQAVHKKKLETYIKIFFFTKDPQSSIQIGISWVPRIESIHEAIPQMHKVIFLIVVSELARLHLY